MSEIAARPPEPPGFIATAWRVLQRARRRPSVIVGLAVVSGLLLAGYRAARPHPVVAGAIVRVTEGDLIARGHPRSGRELRAALSEGALTTRQLAALARRYRMAGPAAGDAELAALVRQRLDIEVRQNYFIDQRADGGPPRSARIALAFHHTDPGTAAAVVHDLAALVVDAEREEDAANAAAAARAARAVAEHSRAHVLALAAQLSVLTAATPSGRKAPRMSPAATVEAQDLMARLHAATEGLRDDSVRALGLDFDARAHRQERVLQFRIVGEATPPRASRYQPAWVALQGLGLALLAIPACALLVGAFDPAVHGRADLDAAGLAVLGVVSRQRSRREVKG